VVTIAIGVFPAQAQLRFESPEHERAVRHLIPLDDYPVADFNAPEPVNAEQRDLRFARNKRHNSTDLSKADIPRFVFQELTNPIQLGLPPSHAPVELAFPVSRSDMVVIGEVKDTAAYLSQDKTDVYSEFAVQIESILRNTSLLQIASNSIISTERGGGHVRLDSGREILRGADGKPMPQVRQRYVFFLVSDAETQSFTIITAYELRNGRAFPLDGSSRFKKEMVIREYAEYDRHENADESTFLNEVKAAISGSRNLTNHWTRGASRTFLKKLRVLRPRQLCRSVLSCFPKTAWKCCLTKSTFRNYNVPMRTRIVKIGNSLGVRIPKLLLEQSRLAEEVEIEAFDRQIVISPARQPRDGWDAAFQSMAQNGDDKLLDADAQNLSSWDETEWQW